MGTLGRRTISIIMSVIMVLSCFAGMTFSVGAETSGDYEYEVLDDGTVSITEYNGSDTDVIIPSEIDGKKVTEIGQKAFCDHFSENITIPNSVTKIGRRAFAECVFLSGITISDSVVQIDAEVFDGCISLKSINVSESNKNYKSVDGILFSKDMSKIVAYPGGMGDEYVIPNSVTEICGGAFMGCINLTSITIPDSVTKIDSSAFGYCEYLENIIIPDSVTQIGKYAFSNCTELKNVTIPNNLEQIEEGVFSKSGLKNVKIPDSVTTIYQYAFEYCDNLKNVIIGNNVTAIEFKAFEGCDKLTSVTIPDSVKTIGIDAFYRCSNLTSVMLGSGITELSKYSFKCYGLQEINVGENNAKYKSVDGVLFNKDMTEIVWYPYGRNGEYVIPDGVTTINRDAFIHCTGLTNITIPNSVTEIVESSFYECTGLTNVIIPAGVTEIGSNAFGYYDKGSWSTIYKIEDLVICGYPGTAAEKYAEENGFKFFDINSCEHKETITKNETSATCTETGYSGDKYCKMCNKLIEKGMEIKALGHKFSDGICTVCGEADPNYKPIENPTETPTEKPTEKPTETPTEKPTEPSTEPATEPSTKAEEKLEFVDNSSVNGKIDEENKKVSVFPSSNAGISTDEFKAMFKNIISIAGEKIEKVFNGMKFTFNGNEYTFILKGDASPDGKITAGDARTILRIAAKLEQPDDVTKESADINSDGKVTSAEARSVLRETF